jgi:hypothetical protein
LVADADGFGDRRSISLVAAVQNGAAGQLREISGEGEAELRLLNTEGHLIKPIRLKRK